MLAKEQMSNKLNFKYADGLLYMMSALLGAAYTFKTETVAGWFTCTLFSEFTIFFNYINAFCV
jgi:hypothetical protein